MKIFKLDIKNEQFLEALSQFYNVSPPFNVRAESEQQARELMQEKYPMRMEIDERVKGNYIYLKGE